MCGHLQVPRAVHEELPVLVKPPVLLASRLRALAEKIVIDPRFRVSIGSGVTTELQALFNAAADAVDENEELRCQRVIQQSSMSNTQDTLSYKSMLPP
jgi:hypothetical protein